jgi:hypothetical protein
MISAIALDALACTWIVSVEFNTTEKSRTIVPYASIVADEESTVIPPNKTVTPAGDADLLTTVIDVTIVEVAAGTV